MSKKKLVWNHKKHGKGFEGHYLYTGKKRDRVFSLVKPDGKRLKSKIKSYESPQAARKDGWVSE